MIRPLAVAGFSALAALLLVLCVLPSAALVPLAVLLLVAAAPLALVSWQRGRRGKFTPGFWVAALAAGLALLRLLAAQNTADKLLTFADDRPHVLNGAVLSTGKGLYEGVYSAEIRVTAIDGTECTPFKVHCGNMENGEIGQQLQITAELQGFSGGYQRYQYGRGIFLRAQQLQPGSEQVLGLSDDLTARLARIRRALGDQFLPLGRSLGGVAAAMVVGDDSYLAESTEEQYRQAGITHLLVVSGMHISLLCSVISWCFLKLFFRRRYFLRAGLTIVIMLAYMSLMGFSASVVRAGVLCLLMLIAELFRQPEDDLTTMGIALILLLAANPYAACDMSLLLSFAAILGVLCFSYVDENHIFLARFGIVGKAVAGLGSALLASFFTLPVLAVSGTTISAATLLCNVLCLPLVLPVMVVGVIFLTSHLITGTSSLLISGQLLKVLLGVMEWFAALANRVFSTRYGVSGPMAVVVVMIAALVAYLVYFSPARPFAAPACIGCLLLLWGVCAALTAGTVRIALAGTGINPAVIISRDQRCAVILRGGDDALADVQEYMAVHNLDQPELVMDLSDRDRTHTVHDLGGVDVVVPRQLYAASFTCLDDIQLTAIRQSEGSLCYITVDGYSVGVCAGPVNLTGYPACSIWLSGHSRPTELEASMIVRNDKLPAWLTELQPEIPVYSGSTPAIWLRPGKAVRILGAVLQPEEQ